MKLWRVVRWELLQHLRDPLTLLLMVVVPLVLYPLAGFASQRVQETGASRVAAAPMVVAVSGGAIDLPAPVETVRVEAPRAAVEAGTADAGVHVDAAGAEVWTDSRNKQVDVARARITDALDTIRTPRVEAVDLVSADERRTDQTARLIPALLVVTLLMGGLYTALDIVTGEKERGTLETLLTTAVDRRVVFTAKFLVVLLFTVVSAALSVAAGQISLRLYTDIVISFGTTVACFVLFLPIAVLLAVVLTLAAAWVPDFKSGQVLSVPMLLVPALAASAALFPGVELTWAWALVPLANLSIALRQVVIGEVPTGPLILAVVSSTAYTALALSVGARFLGREAVLLGTRGSGQRRMVGDYRADALAAYVVGLMLLWFVGQAAQAWDLVPGLILTQIGLLVPLAIGTVTWVGLPLRETLALRLPSRRDLALSLAAGACMPGIGLTVSILQEPLLPAPVGIFDDLMPVGVAFPVVLLVFAVLPGLCEELLFRGALLGLLRRRPGVWGPVLLVAGAFGLFHLSIFRLAPTGILGILLGLLVVRGRSLLCSVVAHTTNNALLMTAAVYLPTLTPGWWSPVLGGAAIGLTFLVGRHHTRT